MYTNTVCANNETEFKECSNLILIVILSND